MKYRMTCLTPTLIGDGQKLAPIDYMVWKDHVNVLDQRRIFRLLAKGPRLDGYLAQLKKAEKLDFASWGGFAQNFAGRRIPFEHSSAIPCWERAQAENLFIPTFAESPTGPYIPGTALKGALRTGAVFDRWNEKTMSDLAARLAAEDRAPRNPATGAERLSSAGSRQEAPWNPAASTTARPSSPRWPHPARRLKGAGRSAPPAIVQKCSARPIATPPDCWRATNSIRRGPA